MATVVGAVGRGARTWTVWAKMLPWPLMTAWRRSIRGGPGGGEASSESINKDSRCEMRERAKSPTDFATMLPPEAKLRDQF